MPDQQMSQQASAAHKREFGRRTETHRRELLVHCYRMLGSLTDAEDMVQETLLRAWKSLESYAETGNFRAWLYKIATNICLDELRSGKRHRALIQPDVPMTKGPYPADPPLDEAYWLHPLPDHLLPPEQTDPAALYTLRESVHLAFMTALHALSPRNRAILILRDVLDWKAREVADYLDITEAAVNSALLRARRALEDTNFEHYRRRHDPELIETYFQRYIDAWETKDIAKLLAILKEDVIMNMPPFPIWMQGKEQLQAFLSAVSLAGDDVARWKTHTLGVNGQPGLAFYARHQPAAPYTLVGIHVLTIRESGIARIDYFILDARPMVDAPLPAPWLPSFGLPTTLRTVDNPIQSNDSS